MNKDVEKRANGEMAWKTKICTECKQITSWNLDKVCPHCKRETLTDYLLEVNEEEWETAHKEVLEFNAQNHASYLLGGG